MMTIPIWYVPSFYGDVRIERVDNNTSKLIAAELSPLESEAMTKLEEHARSKGWWSGDASLGEGEHILKCPVERVSKKLASLLKSGRKIVSAVMFSGGEMREAVSYGETVAVTAPPASTPVTAAASVAAPTIGCPAPAFDQAEIRAREVLTAFLTPEQIEDFGRYNRFVTEGVSGRRYMITSRHAKSQLMHFQRSLYDLDDDMPLCVHDWSVPAAEEMLGLHLLLQLDGWEEYLRGLTAGDYIREVGEVV